MPLRLPPPGRSAFDVVGVGQNSLDIVAVVDGLPALDSKQSVETIAKFAGGQVAGALVACARQGWRTRYAGAFGDDDHGAAVMRALHAEGVDLSASLTRRAETHQTLMLVERATGHRTAIWRHDPRLALSPSDVDAAVATSGRILLVDAQDIEASTAAARAARRAGVPTVVDIDDTGPGAAALLREIDVLIAAEAFPSAHTGVPSVGTALRALATDSGAAVAVVTLGEHGALARCGEREFRVPAFPVSVVDATGAGDAFRGGFIAAWLRYGDTADLETLLEFASAAAAMNCRQLGAQTGLPTRGELDAFVTGMQPLRSNLAGTGTADAGGTVAG